MFDNKATDECASLLQQKLLYAYLCKLIKAYLRYLSYYFPYYFLFIILLPLLLGGAVAQRV